MGIDEISINLLKNRAKLKTTFIGYSSDEVQAARCSYDIHLSPFVPNGVPWTWPGNQLFIFEINVFIVSYTSKNFNQRKKMELSMTTNKDVMKTDLYRIFGIAHLDCNALWCDIWVRQSRPNVGVVHVPACWDISAVFVFGLRLQQDLRPRPGASLLSWIPRDLLPASRGLRGGLGGQCSDVPSSSRPLCWPHPDSQPLRHCSAPSEG